MTPPQKKPPKKGACSKFLIQPKKGVWSGISIFPGRGLIFFNFGGFGGGMRSNESRSIVIYLFISFVVFNHNAVRSLLMSD